MAILDFAFPAVIAVALTTTQLVQRLHLRPDIVKKIQKEIDDVVGTGALPKLDHRSEYSHLSDFMTTE